MPAAVFRTAVEVPAMAVQLDFSSIDRGATPDFPSFLDLPQFALRDTGLWSQFSIKMVSKFV